MDEAVRRRRRLGRASSAAALLLLAGVAAAVWWSRREPPPPPASAAVEVADVTQIVRVAGVLRPLVRVDVGAQVSGQIEQVGVALGDRVRRGQLLASIDAKAAVNDVRKAEAELSRQLAANARTDVELRAERVELRRQRALRKAGAASHAEVDAAMRRVALAQADARAGAATLAQVRAELRNRKLALGHTRVLAPIDGVVVQRPAEAGQTVNAVQQTPLLMVLAQLGTMTVRAKVPEADIDHVRVGQPATFVTLAAGVRRYSGNVRAIEPEPEAAFGAKFYNALFDVDNADEALRSDMTVQVDIVSGQARAVPTIPLVALGDRGDDGRFSVWQLGADGVPQRRSVEVGLYDDARVQVVGGLETGARVLLQPPAAASGAH
ncbi:macrolide export protein MacA [mine drainage metagenome]|jgi:macrolide-specific efflux system membrane fusion protein|uniref:Macrolide export protein MacA n=1 Tax=mine drainage metagenome TaxID=410659 RepID=A0A1J5R4L4_9ZZZZ